MTASADVLERHARKLGVQIVRRLPKILRRRLSSPTSIALRDTCPPSATTTTSTFVGLSGTNRFL